MRTSHSNLTFPRSPCTRTAHSGAQFSYEFHHFSGGPEYTIPEQCANLNKSLRLSEGIYFIIFLS